MPKPCSIADLEPKMRLDGIVKETQLYGAIVDIGLERDGMVHISQLAPRRVNRVTDVVEPGDNVTVWVTRVDVDKGRIALTMVEPPDVDWGELQVGQVHMGVVERLESYGAFVNIGAERPGLLHVREMSQGYLRHPSELVKTGDEIEVKISQIDRQKRRIDLTMLGINTFEEQYDEEDEEEEESLTAMEIALQLAQAEDRSEKLDAPRRSRSRKSKRRQGKRKAHDFSEREDILARTLALDKDSSRH
jgi:transcriptional accessory protein Tex/SPT6